MSGTREPPQASQAMGLDSINNRRAIGTREPPQASRAMSPSPPPCDVSASAGDGAAAGGKIGVTFSRSLEARRRGDKRKGSGLGFDGVPPHEDGNLPSPRSVERGRDRMGRDANRKKLRTYQLPLSKGGDERGLYSHTQPSADISLRGTSILPWVSPRPHVRIEAEKNLLPVLMHYGKKERGKFCRQAKKRVLEVDKTCNEWGVDVFSALSLRRHHIKLYHPHKSMGQLGLGPINKIREAALLYEECVEEHLVRSNIKYETEEQQKERCQSGQQPLTPDFLFPEPVRLRHAVPGKSDKPSTQLTTIHWLEAKMFYGASTIPTGTNSAVGSVRGKMLKYRQLYGPGAIVFAYGGGESLACDLHKIDVITLDSYPLDQTKVRKHLLTWCSDYKGRILP